MAVPPLDSSASEYLAGDASCGIKLHEGVLGWIGGGVLPEVESRPARSIRIPNKLTYWNKGGRVGCPKISVDPGVGGGESITIFFRVGHR